VKVWLLHSKRNCCKRGQKVIEVIKEYGEEIPLTKGRRISASQLLERFLFDKKKQYDFVEKLSGGEQKRLYLCTVLIQNPNFLILDEPTNDLDVCHLKCFRKFLARFSRKFNCSLSRQVLYG
jgi:ATP-binding cassette subfamily F protein uup